jgi:hypothetical protein
VHDSVARFVERRFAEYRYLEEFGRQDSSEDQFQAEFLLERRDGVEARMQ